MKAEGGEMGPDQCGGEGGGVGVCVCVWVGVLDELVFCGFVCSGVKGGNDFGVIGDGRLLL